MGTGRLKQILPGCHHSTTHEELAVLKPGLERPEDGVLGQGTFQVGQVVHVAVGGGGRGDTGRRRGGGAAAAAAAAATSRQPRQLDTGGVCAAEEFSGE